ncbi:MAG TPA: WD40 repeat domain-containing serine/threonine protein kinase, partial [Gemmatimonadales bacterium]|nr:WD40 repeat domain-containing serine/threonine protein kinase [Gemmatimonadales bacterium]
GAERFLAEIKTTANLQHPHILPLFDSGQVDGTVFYVMPFVEGESLRDLLAREKQLPVDEAVRIAREVADALQYAHAHGIIHRDIKPENILIQGGHALVADFGIALAASKTGGTRMTETGMSLGTPQYMSPEQAMGERELDARTDVYALGCVTYEMLSGEPPFTGPTAQAIVAKVLTEAAPSARTKRASVPENVDAAIRVALQKTPADRYRSAAEFAAALTSTATSALRRAADGPPPRTPRVSPLAAGGLVIGVAIVAALVGAWFGGRRVGSDPGLQIARQLTFDGNVTAVAISADGRSLAYATDDCLGQLYVCNLSVRVRDVDGTQSVTIAKSWHAVAELKWSPDGALLAIRGSPDSTPNAVYLTDKLGGSMRPVRVAATAMAFTGDSRFMVFAVGDARQLLQRYDLATLARVDSVVLPPNWFVRDLSYSPDRKQAIVMVESGVASTFVVALLAADGRIVDSVAEPGAARAPIRWAPDGSAIYTFEFAPGVADNLIRIPIRGERIDTVGRTIALGQVNDGIQGLFDVSLTGRFAFISSQLSWGMTLHTGAAEAPWRLMTRRTGFVQAWSIAPDGQSVAAAATDNLGDNIAVFPFDSTRESHAITVSRAVHQWPQWTPDGKHVAYSAFAGTGTIAMSDVSGGAERRITANASNFTWRSNDALVLLNVRTITTVDTTGHVRDDFAIPAQFQPDGSSRPVRDPSSSRIAYASAIAGGIVVVDLARKTFTVAGRARNEMAVEAWSQDGQAIYFEGVDDAAGADGQRARRVFRVALGGGAPKVVLTLPAFCVGAVMDTDARHVVCQMARRAPDIWLADKAGHSGW